MSRPWFEQGQYRDSLEEKIAQGWFISVNDGDMVGQVTRLIYAGYKLLLPDQTERNINPNNDKVEDIPSENREEAFDKWTKKNNEIVKVQIQLNLQRQEEQTRKKEHQATCLHEKVTSECVVRAAGCDIYDTTCDTCGKCLRRSWSTAYERDPDDLISDWNWWKRYYKKQYNGEPSLNDYSVVEEIS